MKISRSFLQDLLDVYSADFMNSRRNGRFVSLHIFQGTMPTQAQLSEMYRNNKVQSGPSLDITSKEVVTQLVAEGGVQLGSLAFTMDANTKKFAGPDLFKRVFTLSRDTIQATVAGTMNYLVIQRGSVSAVNVTNARIDHVLIYSIGAIGSGADIEVSNTDVVVGTKVLLNDITLDFTQLLTVAG